MLNSISQKLLMIIGFILILGGLATNAFITEISYLMNNQTDREFISYLASHNRLDLTRDSGSVSHYRDELNIEGPLRVIYYHRISPEELAYKEKQIADGERINTALVLVGDAAILYRPADKETTEIIGAFRPGTGLIDPASIHAVMAKVAYRPLRQARLLTGYRDIFSFFAALHGIAARFSYPFRWLAVLLIRSYPAIVGIWPMVLMGFGLIISALPSFRPITAVRRER